jgi:hypothetical protein
MAYAIIYRKKESIQIKARRNTISNLNPKEHKTKKGNKDTPKQTAGKSTSPPLTTTRDQPKQMFFVPCVQRIATGFSKLISRVLYDLSLLG